MNSDLKIAVEFNEKELKGKEKIIFDYKPLYEEVRKILSDLYVLGSICETLESQGLIAIDEKEKAYFGKFKKYDNLKQLEKTEDQFVNSSLYFEELYECYLNNNQTIKIEFKNEIKIKNPYIKNSINKWKLEERK